MNLDTRLSIAMMTAPSAGALPRLTYYGRASIKIRTAEGKVLYVDPYEGDYSEPADLILVTHGHGDHNQVGKVTRKNGCIIAAPKDAVEGAEVRVLAEGSRFEAAGVSIRAVPAYNKNHPRGSEVAYVLGFDGLVLYHAGDTSRIPEMESLAALGIDYALLPADGFYNMGAEEAAVCAKTVGAKHCLPIHTSANELFDAVNAKALAALAPGGIVVEPGGGLDLRS